VLSPFPPKRAQRRRAAASCAIGRTDGEDQLPLAKQGAVSRDERVARVINAGGFRGSAVQLHDFEISPLFEIFFVLVANVVATNIKTRDLSRDTVDHALERVGPEVSAVAKDASLRMIAGLDQFEDFADRKYLASAMSKSSQVSARNQRGTRISSNQFLNRANPVAGDRREDLFGDRKDLPASFAGKAKIKDPSFM